VKEPRRVALAVLYEIFGDAVFALDAAPVHSFSEVELRVLKTMLASKVNAPLTSSAGRLFDAVASLAGIRQKCGFEGQAAMELEFAAGYPMLSEAEDEDVYPYDVRPGAPLILDWEPMIRAILADSRVASQGCPTSASLWQMWVSTRFHHTLAHMMVEIAERVGERNVVLSGGCFQNRLLTEMVIGHMRNKGFRAYWHQRIPPSDGGIALGQVVAAAKEMVEHQ
jgi:hydrogenase maturation protein HypF